MLIVPGFDSLVVMASASVSAEVGFILIWPVGEQPASKTNGSQFQAWQKAGIWEVSVTNEMSHKPEMAGPFNMGDTIINTHFTLL